MWSMPSLGCARLKVNNMAVVSVRWVVGAVLAGLASLTHAQSTTYAPTGSVEKAVTLYRVIGISDGDTMTVMVDSKPMKLRLANIDAPEKSQPFGERSKQSLSELCYGKDVAYQVQDIDKYGRTVAVVFCSGVEANRAQVERGMAWVYKKYNKDSTLPELEMRARYNQKGLWSEARPVPPWEFRRLR